MFLSLSEQQYLVSDTTSRSTKQQGMLETWGNMAPLTPSGFAYSLNVSFRQKFLLGFDFKFDAATEQSMQ